MSRRSPPPRLPLRAALFAVAMGCTTAGRFEGDLVESNGEAKPGPYQQVRFAWSSRDGGQSGDMEATMPSGETFTGSFHQITRTTTTRGIDGFFGAWYGGPWAGPGWAWGGAWPYYDDPHAFIVFYTGKVVALLESPEGNAMRCHFELLDSGEGMKEGGVGECQVEDGRRVTAWFGPSEPAAVS